MLAHTHKAKDVDQALASLRQHITMRLVQIEGVCRNYGLPEITNFTLIARDPNNDKMVIVVTNEGAEGVKVATELAVNLSAKQ